MNNFMNSMFGKIGSGMCRLAMSGGIAVKTSSGYKTCDVKKMRLTNCNNFVITGMDDMFFLIPTNKVEVGDIIVPSGSNPRCVVEVGNNTIKVINYETSAIEEIMPERHMFMGNVYFYGKIVSMFGNISRGKGAGNVMKFMMMNQMMSSMNGGNNSGGMSAMMMPMLMSGMGGSNNFFDEIFGSMFEAVSVESTDDEDEGEN